MTSVEEFHAILDRRWNDWQTRLILADWLDDHATTEEDRLRARGYRELGTRRIRPYLHPKTDNRDFMRGHVRERRWQFWSSIANERLRPCLIPEEIIGPSLLRYYHNKTRRELEDDFALRIGRYLTQQEQKT